MTMTAEVLMIVTAIVHAVSGNGHSVHQLKERVPAAACEKAKESLRMDSLTFNKPSTHVYFTRRVDCIELF